jgi:hypothetical protein
MPTPGAADIGRAGFLSGSTELLPEGHSLAEMHAPSTNKRTDH